MGRGFIDEYKFYGSSLLLMAEKSVIETATKSTEKEH